MSRVGLVYWVKHFTSISNISLTFCLPLKTNSKTSSRASTPALTPLLSAVALSILVSKRDNNNFNYVASTLVFIF